MSDHVNPRPVDRRSAERLLNDPAAAGPETDRLAALLTSVTAPARPGEWHGEAQALTAFRSARLAPGAGPRRPSMLRTAAAKLLTVKIGLICAASLGVGGVAFAASTDSLPGPLHLGGDHLPGNRPAYPTGAPSGRPAHPSASAPAGLAALCHDYAGRDPDHRRRALADPAFHELVGRAGTDDRGRVDEFCAKLDHGWPSDWPDDWPSGRPSSGPSGRPTALPTGQAPGGGRPGEHPSGEPRPGTAPTAFPHPGGTPRG